MAEWLENLQNDELNLIDEGIDEEDILFDETLDNLWINKESWIFKEQMWSFPRLRYRFTIEKWDTLGWIVKNRILTNYPELTDQDRQNWVLIKPIIELIKESNDIENENNLTPWTKISVKKRKVLKIVNDYIKDHPEIVRMNHRNYIEINSIEDFDIKRKKEPLVDRLYHDDNIKPEIDDALKNWQKVLVPSYTETKDSPIFENINDIIEPETILGEELKGKTFEIDPWHGFNDPWALWLVSYWEPSQKTKIVVFESAIAMDMAYRTARLLKAHWAKIEFTHYIPTRGISDIMDLAPCLQWWPRGSATHQDKWTDKTWYTRWEVSQTTSINTRKDMTNADNPNMFISLHLDSSSAESNNHLVLVDINDPKYKDSKEFADYLIANWMWEIKITGTDPKKNKSKWVLKYSNCPSVLIELWNIKNTNDAYRFRDPERRQKKAEELVNIIINYYLKKQNGK